MAGAVDGYPFSRNTNWHCHSKTMGEIDGKKKQGAEKLIKKPISCIGLGRNPVSAPIIKAIGSQDSNISYMQERLGGITRCK